MIASYITVFLLFGVPTLLGIAAMISIFGLLASGSALLIVSLGGNVELAAIVSGTIATILLTTAYKKVATYFSEVEPQLPDYIGMLVSYAVGTTLGTIIAVNLLSGFWALIVGTILAGTLPLLGLWPAYKLGYFTPPRPKGDLLEKVKTWAEGLKSQR